MPPTPPPGYNTSSINTQNVNAFNTPGPQGLISQGYQNNPYRSSYAMPSNYLPPSSVQTQNQYYNQAHSPNVASMIRALMQKGQ